MIPLLDRSHQTLKGLPQLIENKTNNVQEIDKGLHFAKVLLENILELFQTHSRRDIKVPEQNNDLAPKCAISQTISPEHCIEGLLSASICSIKSVHSQLGSLSAKMKDFDLQKTESEKQLEELNLILSKKEEEIKHLKAANKKLNEDRML